MKPNTFEQESIMDTLENDSLIVVSDLVENEDGSATVTIDTTREATRLLVEIGLTRLLEMAIDKENGYELKRNL